VSGVSVQEYNEDEKGRNVTRKGKMKNAEKY
jgi:hypothetical protein